MYMHRKFDLEATESDMLSRVIKGNVYWLMTT